MYWYKAVRCRKFYTTGDSVSYWPQHCKQKKKFGFYIGFIYWSCNIFYDKPYTTCCTVSFSYVLCQLIYYIKCCTLSRGESCNIFYFYFLLFFLTMASPVIYLTTVKYSSPRTVLWPALTISSGDSCFFFNFAWSTKCIVDSCSCIFTVSSPAWYLVATAVNYAQANPAL